MTHPASAATLREIDEVFRTWETQAQTGVAENMAKLIARDCIWHQQGMPPVNGTENCTALLRSLVAISTELGSKPVPPQVLKMHRGTVMVDNVENPTVAISAHTFTQKLANGEPMECQSLSVFERRPNEQVKFISKRISNSFCAPPSSHLQTLLAKLAASSNAGTSSVSA